MLGGDLFNVYRKPDAVTTELDIYRETSGHHANWTVLGRTLALYRDKADLKRFVLEID